MATAVQKMKDLLASAQFSFLVLTCILHVKGEIIGSVALYNKIPTQRVLFNSNSNLTDSHFLQCKDAEKQNLRHDDGIK